MHVDHDGQRIVVDLDRLGRQLRLLERVGDDEGDRVADMAHGVEAEERMLRHLLVGAVDLAELDLAGQAGDVGHVRAGEDEMDPRHGAGGGRGRRA